MNIAAKLLTVAVLTAAGVPLTGVAAEAAPPADSASPIQYRPPLRGAPTKRVGGATRSIVSFKPSLTAIAPNHVGITLRSQPVLYWHAAQSPTAPMVFKLFEEDSGGLHVVRTLPATGCAGFYRMDLADLGTTLKEEVDYRWQVSLAADQQKESAAVGRIRLAAADVALASRLAQAPPAERRRILAEAGIWYDLMSETVAQTGSPQDVADFESLLSQGGVAASLARSPACF